MPVELDIVPGVFHGFDIVAPEMQIAKHFRLQLSAALKRAFATTS